MAVSTKSKATTKSTPKAKTTFSLEIQHEGLNVSTKALEKYLKAHLKNQGVVLSGYHLKSFFVPNHQTLYYSVERDEHQVVTGSLSLEELMAQ